MKKNRFKQKNFAYALYATLGAVLVGAIVYAIYLGTTEPAVVPVDGMSNLLQPPNLSLPVNQSQQFEQQANIQDFFNQSELVDENHEIESQVVETTEEYQVVEYQAVEYQTVESQVVETQYTDSQVLEASPEPAFPTFTGETNMLWPVVGEVALEYSSEAMIWDPTLELFSRNDTMRIASMAGEHVRAATDGIISDISYNTRYGNTITIDHGNGWVTTYNQLDGITVNAGDVVVTGQIIGTVAEPTRFTVALGDNIGFRVTHNEDSVNPLTLLP